MKTIEKIDISYLKGDYYIGFKEIQKSLKTNLIPAYFKKEVESDLLELLIRNQKLGKSFDEVIGGNLSNFIDDLMDAYVFTLSKKELFLNTVKMGLLFMTVFTLISVIDLTPSVATLFISAMAFIFGVVTYLLSYDLRKTHKTFPEELTGALFGFFTLPLINLMRDNFNFFNTIENSTLSAPIYIAIIIVEFFAIFLISKKLKQENI